MRAKITNKFHGFALGPGIEEKLRLLVYIWDNILLYNKKNLLRGMGISSYGTVSTSPLRLPCVVSS